LGIVTGVDHVGLTVTDLDRSVKFYTEVLDCDVVVAQEKRGGYLAAIVGYPDADVKMAHLQPPGGGQRIELFQYRNPVSRPRDLEPRNVGNAHLCFVVDDVDALYQRVVSRGAETFSAPVEVDTGVNKGGAAFYMRDPDGITLEIFQRPKRSQEPK
jgi:catechol 2,3-dioxygenase-like lactoylglutathione lyase family enzyme